MSSTKVLQTAEANYKQKTTITIIASNLVVYEYAVEEAKFVVVRINGQ
jgi:hypothetical protein